MREQTVTKAPRTELFVRLTSRNAIWTTSLAVWTLLALIYTSHVLDGPGFTWAPSIPQGRRHAGRNLLRKVSRADTWWGQVMGYAFARDFASHPSGDPWNDAAPCGLNWSGSVLKKGAERWKFPVFLDQPFTTDDVERKHKELYPGGRWWPKDCGPVNPLVIVVPYRNREIHLPLFLHNMHRYLQIQNANYSIVIVEQKDKHSFNRGLLLNIGFHETMKQFGRRASVCFAFHDVDMIPEDVRALYRCGPNPIHMVMYRSHFGYRRMYQDYFGGASLMTAGQFHQVNGYSNVFYGWGGEDDDLRQRLLHRGLVIHRTSVPVKQVLMFKSLQHKPAPRSNDRFRNVRSGASRFETDGLSDIDAQYTLLGYEERPTYIHYTVALQGKVGSPTRHANKSAHVQSSALLRFQPG